MFDQTSATTLMDTHRRHQLPGPSISRTFEVRVSPGAGMRPNRPKLIPDAVAGEVPPERRALFQTLATAIGQVVGHQTMVFRMRWSIP